MSPPTGYEGVARSGAQTGKKPEAVRIWLLGGFRVSVGSRTIEENAWRLRKAAALVKLLALASGHRLHREQIIDVLWPDSGTRAASNNLRKTLHAARRTLDPAAGSRYLSSDNESLMLCPGGDLWIDVEAFEEAAATARRSKDPAAYRTALDLYAGDLLPEDRYEEWAESRRQELRRSYLSLLVELAGLYEVRGEHERGIEALQTVVTEEPTLEEAHVGLMRLHALSGGRRDALQQYERLREVLSRELGAEPDATTRQLRDDIAAGRFPPAQLTGPPQGELLDTGKHNLPAPRTSLVGREREMVEIKRALTMTRLLTLTGAGGSGKTRLALEVTRDLVGAYPDGAWLAELASLSEEALVPKAVAGALGVQERPGQPLTDVLVDVLGGTEMLLVLDNCEHLVQAAALLVDSLLDACPRLRILATSREALGVRGEIRWAVPPLSMPERGRTLSPKELEGYESVRLFVERARERDPAFSLSPQNALAVAEICRRLEGIPLAIELAAARVGTLSAEQISKRLGASLELLTHGGRTAVPRQKTLRGTLTWSYDLLLEAEKVLFRRLSVFAGGWTLEAAEAVAAVGLATGIEEGDVLDLLSSLVDKSLIVAEATEDVGVRYRLLEPVRQYALERLEESGEAETIRRWHAESFLALAEEAELELTGPRQAQWFKRLETEQDNIRAALSWTIDQEEAEIGLRLAGALRLFWFMQGYSSEGRQWLEQVLTRDSRASAAARAKALAALGWLASMQEDMDRAEEAAEEGLGLSDEAGIGGSLAAFLRSILGDVALTRGDYGRAEKLYDEGLKIYEEAGDRRSMAWNLGALGNVSIEREDYEQARQFYEEVLSIARELGDATTLGICLSNLGYIFLLEGDHERATALNEEAAVLLRERGHRGLLIHALDHLGWAAILRGDYGRSKVLHEESLALCEELGEKVIAAESLEGLACVAGARGEAQRMARLFGAAEALYGAVGYQQRPAANRLREPYLAAARSLLGEAAWEAAVTKGQAMTFEQAVEYALSGEELPSSSTPMQDKSAVGTQPAILTRREEEISALVVRGLTNRQIASELHLSEHTVATHVRRIFKKLGLRSRVELAAWVSE